MGDFDTVFWIVICVIGGGVLVFATVGIVRYRRKINHPIDWRRNKIRERYGNIFDARSAVDLKTQEINDARERYSAHADKHSISVCIPVALRYGLRTDSHITLIAGTFYSSPIGMIAGTSMGQITMGLAGADYINQRMKCALAVLQFPLTYTASGVLLMSDSSGGIMKTIFGGKNANPQQDKILKELFGDAGSQPLNNRMQTTKRSTKVMIRADGKYCYVQCRSNKPLSLKKEFMFIEQCMKDVINLKNIFTSGR